MARNQEKAKAQLDAKGMVTTSQPPHINAFSSMPLLSIAPLLLLLSSFAAVLRDDSRSKRGDSGQTETRRGQISVMTCMYPGRLSSTEI